MKMIRLDRADRCELVYMGSRYKFEKGVPVEVPHELADRLIKSGEFTHILSIDQVVIPGVKMPEEKAEAPAPVTPRKVKAAKQ